MIPVHGREGAILSIARVMIALLFLQHAMQKSFGFPAPYPFGPVTPVSLVGLAAAIEMVGGLLLLFGAWTRAAAFVLSGQMAVAYFLAHGLHGFYPILNGGELAALYCFTFLLLTVVGGGRWSVDSLRASDR